jgi:hypothetical protein
VSQARPSWLEERVVSAADAALRDHNSVSPLDVLVGIGWLPWSSVDVWRQGRLETLEQVAAVDADRLATALEILRHWAKRKGLKPNDVAYVARTRDRRPLQFTVAGKWATERAYRTHWVSPELSEAKRERLTQRQSRAPDLVVISPLKDWTCTSCGGTGSLLFMEGDGPLCLSCADLDHLDFLPAGDAALSRRAKKESGLAAVVVRFSRTRKRYERQGLLVEPAALERAEEQCLADEDVRARRRERDRERRTDEDVEFQAQLAKEIVRVFPGCPAARAEAIARHSAARGTGRVGRSAAARTLDEDAIRLAVVASIRHQDTPYDELLMSGIPRPEARAAVDADIDRVLDAWRNLVVR